MGMDATPSGLARLLHLRIIFAVSLGPLVLAAGMGCGPKAGKPPVAAQKPDYPAWVAKGSGAASDATDRALYGVGQVSGMKNRALARVTADNRARAEIAKVFETYSAALMKDYMASTTAGDPVSPSEEQHVEQIIKTFSAATLSGVQIVDHWTPSDSDDVYALARLDLKTIQDHLRHMKELNAQVQDYVRSNADRVYDLLEKEEEKRRVR